MWNIFETKVSNFAVLVSALHIFKKYTRHVLLKYIKNGYDRAEFRSFLGKLKEYDFEGNLIKTH